MLRQTRWAPQNVINSKRVCWVSTQKWTAYRYLDYSHIALAVSRGGGRHDAHARLTCELRDKVPPCRRMGASEVTRQMNVRAIAHRSVQHKRGHFCYTPIFWGEDVKSEVELIAEAEALLDETVAYEAARAVHQLKRRLGIDIQQINLEVRPAAGDAGSYHALSARY